MPHSGAVSRGFRFRFNRFQLEITSFSCGLAGGWDERFNSNEIRRLYEASDYPLRKAD
jgi:hypothetical protein